LETGHSVIPFPAASPGVWQLETGHSAHLFPRRLAGPFSTHPIRSHPIPCHHENEREPKVDLTHQQSIRNNRMCMFCSDAIHRIVSMSVGHTMYYIDCENTMDLSRVVRSGHPNDDLFVSSCISHRRTFPGSQNVAPSV